MKTLYLLFILTMIIPSLGFAQYFTVDSFTDESPYNKEFAFIFPKLKSATNQSAADLINKDLTREILNLESGQQSRSIFEKIWGEKEMDIPRVSDISFKVVNNDADFFCISISATACVNACESWTRYYVKESHSGATILITELFTRDGLNLLFDSVSAIKTRRIQAYTDTLKYSLSKKMLSDDDKRDYQAAIDQYAKCMQKSESYTVYSLDKKRITIHVGRCLPFALQFLDKVDRDVAFDISTFDTFLSDYGKKLLK